MAAGADDKVYVGDQADVGLGFEVNSFPGIISPSIASMLPYCQGRCRFVMLAAPAAPKAVETRPSPEIPTNRKP